MEELACCLVELVCRSRRIVTSRVLVYVVIPGADYHASVDRSDSERVGKGAREFGRIRKSLLPELRSPSCPETLEVMRHTELSSAE
jgi:hypothetical protein